MPTQQQEMKKELPEIVRFLFIVAGAFSRLALSLFNKKNRILGILGKSIETALKLQTQDKKSASSLKTEHTAANTKLTKIQNKAKGTQYQRSSQPGAWQRKNESADMLEKINTIKTEVDQLSQQIRDCSSQTQPGAIEAAIQQNKG